MKRKVDFSCLADKWPSAMVAREDVGKFSGGLLHPATMANHDSAGTGPKNRFRVGKKVVYWVKDLIAWMEERASYVDEEVANA